MNKLCHHKYILEFWGIGDHHIWAYIKKYLHFLMPIRYEFHEEYSFLIPNGSIYHTIDNLNILTKLHGMYQCDIDPIIEYDINCFFNLMINNGYQLLHDTLIWMLVDYVLTNHCNTLRCDPVRYVSLMWSLFSSGDMY